VSRGEFVYAYCRVARGDAASRSLPQELVDANTAGRGVTQATVNAMWAEFDAWAERPDAFFVVTFCEAVGWRGE
jgi:hypothetical protein